MIQCGNHDKKELLTFLKKEPSKNGFFIGDVENHSLEEDFLNVWMLKRDGQIKSVLLRFYRYFHISTSGIDTIKEISDEIKKYPEAVTVSGTETVINGLSRYIDFQKIRKMFLAELKEETFVDIDTGIEPEKAGVEDIDELYDFDLSIEEFASETQSKDGYGEDIKRNTGRIYYIRENSRIVAKAGLTAENSENGVIVGVATDKTHRNRGYAKACLVKLCRELVTENKRAVLFYDNPDASKLYKSIGFTDIGRIVTGIIDDSDQQDS